MICTIHFPTHGITQIKRMIPHSEWLRVKALEKDKDYNREVKLLGNGQEWFTDQSPFAHAIRTGVFTCNGVSVRCVVTPQDPIQEWINNPDSFKNFLL